MPFNYARFLVIGLALVFGTGCASEPLRTLDLSNDRPAIPNEWQTVAEGAARISYDLNATTTAVIYRFSPDLFEVDLAAQDPPRRVSAWREALPEARLVVNAAYFHADGGPSGFLAVDGKRVGTRMFDLDKSGFVQAGPFFRLIDTSRVPLDLDAVRDGFQSYPFFFIDGRPAIKRDSGLRARRTFIGTDTEGRIYVGVLARGEMSLHRFMRALEGFGVDWENVLNLDGGPSTGLAARFDGVDETLDSFVSVPSVIFVRQKLQK